MLRKVPETNQGKFMNFSTIQRYSSGSGICYVYNTVMKATKAGKPFITLYLRDANGVSIPGYVFDLKSPLMAGGEATKVTNNLVEIEWEENYLPNVGLTLLVHKVSIIVDASSDDLAVFCGTIPELDGKFTRIHEFLLNALGIKVTLPISIKMDSSVEYAQGRVGGLCEHYYRMSRQLETYGFLSDVEFRGLVGTFALFMIAHSTMVRAKENGNDGIDIITSLTEKITAYAAPLKLSSGALEIVHMFFGYEPKDIYVRTIKALSDSVQKVDKEFALYHTIPLTQEGNAGYGTIRRYQLED